MQINTNRQTISLEETLAFIKYLNRQQPFDREDILIPTRDLEDQANSKQAVQTTQEKHKKIKLEDVSEEDLTKKINKNRAIKRIIESAFQILQNFDNYEEDHGGQSNDKSSEIQFNIYLKQFNRVLEMIYKREKERLTIETEKAQKRQEVLQNIYQYTVVEDFRELLPIAVIKDKISKTSVEIMVDSLTKCLVVLKPNELKIYDSAQATSNFRSIKLQQIQNIDYHTQPYIFIVLAIQKEKEKFNVYMQFQSEKNQEKWDRALYCCFIGRKMKTKEKFFLIEYKEDDVKKKQKQETKKQAAFGYEIDNKKKSLDRILSERNPALSELSREDYEENLSRSNTRGRRKQMSTLSKDDPDDLFQKQEKGSEAVIPASTSKKITESQTNRLLEGERRQREKSEEMINRIKTDYIQVSKPGSPKGLHTPHGKDFTDRSNKNLMIFGNTSNIQDQENGEYNGKEKNLLKEEESSGDILPDDIKQIHNLQRKNVKGLIVEKEKFFFNKTKIIFLKQGNQTQKSKEEYVLSKKIDINDEYQTMKLRQLEYWDFDSKSGEMSQRKVIQLMEVKSCEIKEERLLTIIHSKQIIFSGDITTLKQIEMWIELVRNIYKTKFNNEEANDL